LSRAGLANLRMQRETPLKNRMTYPRLCNTKTYPPKLYTTKTIYGMEVCELVSVYKYHP
jgi:hypothetical protein